MVQEPRQAGNSREPAQWLDGRFEQTKQVGVLLVQKFCEYFVDLFVEEFLRIAAIEIWAIDRQVTVVREIE